MISLLIIGLVICLAIFLAIALSTRDRKTAAAIAIVFAVTGTFVWSLLVFGTAGSNEPSCNEPEKKIVTVQPVGHRSFTSYAITADDGTIMELDNPPVLGQMYCFSQGPTWHWPSWDEITEVAAPTGGKS